jgi:hypothetical protein
MPTREYKGKLLDTFCFAWVLQKGVVEARSSYRERGKKGKREGQGAKGEQGKRE